MSPFSHYKHVAWTLLARLTRSNALLILAFIVLAILVSLSTFYMQSDRSLSLVGAEQVFQGRDFSKTPFGLMDAYDACVLETKMKLGSGMLRDHMLPLSTRFDPQKQEYFVVISADVGTPSKWNEATIYCLIDPVKEQISYYKEVHDGKRSILSETMDMLKRAVQ